MIAPAGLNKSRASLWYCSPFGWDFGSLFYSFGSFALYANFVILLLNNRLATPSTRRVVVVDIAARVHVPRVVRIAAIR